MIFIIESKNHGRHEVLIDDEDWEEFKKYKWKIQKNRNTFYLVRNFTKNRKQYTIALHRQLTGFNMTDHINGNGLDCQRLNLRESTIAQNSRNAMKKSNNTSGYKGVYFNKAVKKWRSQICINFKDIYLGSFKTKDQAAIAYNIAALKYHCEFARLNNIMEHRI